MTKQWNAEKQFVLDCPICREPALPQQVEGDGKSGFALIHPGRIAPCFVRSGTDASEHVRTRFNEWFGTNDTSIASQARSDEISDGNSSITPAWSATYTRHVTSSQYKAIKNWLHDGTPNEINTWESEGGATYQD